MKNYKEMIDNSIKNYFHNSSYVFEKGSQEFLNRGGKRLRSIVCMLTCDAFNGNIKKTLPTATSLEFLHNGSLVIDDIQDESLLRRNKKTLHKEYGLPNALNMFINLWDVSYKSLIDNFSILSRDQTIQIYKQIENLINILLKGQEKDLLFKSTFQSSTDEVTDILKAKSASFFKISGKCGAIIADADKNQIKKIGEYWEMIGLAFQIRDDILDFTGDKNIIGKNINVDLNEGKPTLILAKYLDNCTDDKFLDYKFELKDEKTFEKVRSDILNANIISEVQEYSEILLNDANRILESFDLDEHWENQIKEFSKFFVNRDF